MAVHAFVISPGSSKGKQIPLMHATFDLTPRNEIGPKFCCLRPKAKYLGITGVFVGLVVEFFYLLSSSSTPTTVLPPKFSIFIYQSICLFINLSVYLSIYLFIYQSICLSIILSVYLSIYLFMPIYLFIYQFIFQYISICQLIIYQSRPIDLYQSCFRWRDKKRGQAIFAEEEDSHGAIF